MSDKAPQPFLDDKDVQVRTLSALLKFHAEEMSQGNTTLYVWSRVSYQSRKDNRNIPNTEVSRACVYGDQCSSSLVLRSGKGKTTKNSNEAEYRAIFDNLVSDLLVVLFWPEWPAASLLLGIICKFMV